MPGRRLALVFSLFCALECAAAEPARTLTPKEKLGAELYGRTCAVCHGASGEGYKADQAPSLTQPDFLGSATDEFLRRAIADGRRGTTMSAWSVERGGPLKPEDIAAIIAFLRTWNAAPALALDENPVTGDSVRGAIFYEESCRKCHGAKGVGGPNVNIGDADFLRSAGNGFLRRAIRSGRANTSMPAFGDSHVEDLLALIRSWGFATGASEPPPPPVAPIPLGPVPLNPNGPEPSGFQEYPSFTPADVVKAQYDLHAKMAILDARAPSDYLREHIAGAVSVPFYDPRPYVPALPKDAWLVCYCACPHAESGQLAQKLKDLGFSKVAVIDEGLRVWKARGYPVLSGREP